MNLTVVKKETALIAVETPSGTFKLFQIVCRKDGSIFVPFPYYKNSSAQLIEGTLIGGRQYPSDINVSGPLTTHRVKYAHHADGEAHFSQDGKILTRVRRRANPLQSYSGHLFTVQLQGLSDFPAGEGSRPSKTWQRACLLAPQFRAHISQVGRPFVFESRDFPESASHWRCRPVDSDE